MYDVNPAKYAKDFEVPTDNSLANAGVSANTGPRKKGEYRVHYYNMKNASDLTEYQNLMTKIFNNQHLYTNFVKDVNNFEDNRFICIEYYTTDSDVVPLPQPTKTAKQSNYELLADALEEIEAEGDEEFMEKDF